MSEDLTPAQADAVRRSLRAARHEVPLPEEVAARLDDRLAELVASRASDGAAAVAPVVPLRRRRWPAVLAAAAAVTAIGIGGTQLLDRGAHDTSLTTADRAEATAPSPSSLAGAGDLDNTLDGAMDSLGVHGQVELTRDLRAALARDGIHHVRPLPVVPAAATALQDSTSPEDAPKSTRSDLKSTAAYAAAACGADVPTDLPAGTRLFSGVRRSVPVIIVLRPEPLATTLITAYPCDGGSPTTLPLD